jgi:xanthine/uracil permease
MRIALGVTGIVVIVVGLTLIGLGAYMAWQADAEQRRQKRAEAELRGEGLEGAFRGLAALVDSLAKRPMSINLIVLGMATMVIGGVIGGVGALV